MITIDFSLAVTVLYLIVLYVFLNKLFFKPVTHILSERKRLTEGRLEAARVRLKEVDDKTAQYEQALREARADAYRRQELLREQALTEKAQLVVQAKSEAETVVADARARLLTEAASAKERLETETGVLAERLSAALLRD